MSILPDIVNSYLKKNKVIKWTLEWTKKDGINNVIVVPAIAEFGNIKTLLQSLCENHSEYFKETLIIFVINNTFSSVLEFKENNYSTIKLLKNLIGKQKSDDEFISKMIESGLQIGLVDASLPGKEFDDETGGVGLARRTGFDLALSIFDYSNTDKKILISLDADCIVDKNYLTSVIKAFNRNNLSAGVINYQHNIDVDDKNTQAIICYEIFLRYYVSGLIYAGSPFAFNTIGSTIVCDHTAYIKTGGMNKRKAGEDFYFLQKLAKLYPVLTIYSTTVYPSSRSEVRTPFGTAIRIDSFLSDKEQQYLLYNPESFEVLKNWLKLFNSDSSLNTAGLMKQAEKTNKQLFEFLTSKNFPEQWDKILMNCKNEQQLSYQRKNWFDAFKTLKLIHYLRDHSLKQINMFEAVNKLFQKFDETPVNYDRGNDYPELSIQKKFLLRLRKLQEKHTRYKIG